MHKQERSVFANSTAKHLENTIKEIEDKIELAILLANSTSMINDLRNAKELISISRRRYPELFEII